LAAKRDVADYFAQLHPRGTDVAVCINSTHQQLGRVSFAEALKP
jgi:hypothetical protein